MNVPNANIIMRDSYVLIDSLTPFLSLAFYLVGNGIYLQGYHILRKIRTCVRKIDRRN